jgi:hypothetical protein
MKKRWLVIIVVALLATAVVAQVRLSLDSPAEFPVDI